MRYEIVYVSSSKYIQIFLYTDRLHISLFDRIAIVILNNSLVSHVSPFSIQLLIEFKPEAVISHKLVTMSHVQSCQQ